MDPQLEGAIDRYKMAIAIAREFVEELGEERAHAVIQRALNKMQVEILRDRAEKLGSNSLEALAEYYHVMAAGNPNIQVLEVTDQRIALKLTRCPAFEAFEYPGAPELCAPYCDTSPQPWHSI